MAGVNKVILVGNLGKDPEVRYLEGGTAVARFTLATNETYKDKQGELKEHTEWHNVVLWRKLAEVAEKILKKGSQIYIEGHLRSRTWDDKANVKRHITEIVGENLVLLGKRETASTAGNITGTETLSNNNNSTNSTADDLPF